MDLTPFQVEEILIAEGLKKRKTNTESVVVRKQMRKSAEQVLNGWLAKGGVSKSKWQALRQVPSIQSRLRVLNDSSDNTVPFGSVQEPQTHNSNLQAMFKFLRCLHQIMKRYTFIFVYLLI